MTVVRNYFTNLVPPRPPAIGGTLALPASKGVGGGEAAPAGRAVHDTVELSDGGHKIVNLARGQELAWDIRGAPIDDDFFANLQKAQEDIRRITHLFGETIKAAFEQSRGQE